MNTALVEALENAEELIQILKIQYNLDYSSHKEYIAEQIWNSGHWLGHWSVLVIFPDGLPSLKAIQEDEYDQHMDDGEDRPSWDKMIDSVGSAYLWFDRDL
jgi:hypothetical protein